MQTLYISKNSAHRFGKTLVKQGKADHFFIRPRFARNKDGSADRGYVVVARKGREIIPV